MPGEVCFHEMLVFVGILGGMMVGMVFLYERIMQGQFITTQREFGYFFEDKTDQNMENSICGKRQVDPDD